MAFYGRVALVTGGASGMGQVSVRRLTKQGAHVAVLDMNEASLNAMAAENSRVHPFVCDVSNYDDVVRVISEVEATLGPIDRVTHCAALMPSFPILEMPIEKVMKLMAVNYGGTVNITKVVLPKMIERGTGDLIVFGSIAGHVLTHNMGAYSATKAATNTYMEVLMRENAGKGVRMMLVNPPAVNTPLIQQSLETASPKSLRDGAAKGSFASPDFIIDEIEKAIEKGTEILMPGFQAKILMLWRRLFPGLLWKVMHKANFA